jgi:hypothetical protein
MPPPPLPTPTRDRARVAADSHGAEEPRSPGPEAAREVLLKTARSYGSLITQQKLATQIQDRTDLRTDRQIRHWLGGVLRKVAEDCAARDEPLLIALVVDARGSVGDLYAETLHRAARRGHRPRRRPRGPRAARLPRVLRRQPALRGGLATLAPQVAAARTRTRKKAAEERVIPICPNCYTAVPATGCATTAVTTFGGAGAYPWLVSGNGEGDSCPPVRPRTMLTPVIADQQAPYDEAGSDHLSADPPYRQRCPTRTARVSRGAVRGSEPIFVVQRHEATALHYDLRLQVVTCSRRGRSPRGPRSTRA